ncbi:hypothetical protein HDU83_001087 [Entophlyctis luteolus]|nr:hypothetical protein HDU83_001087 [Entophlyctis luteolus]KAJ3383112.1 hypothetical protein HDU84_003814 [Entophlyctis sp. JEL0112]
MGGGIIESTQAPSVPLGATTNHVNGAFTSPITSDSSAATVTQVKTLASTITTAYISSINSNGGAISTLTIACIIIGSILTLILVLVAAISVIRRRHASKVAIRQHDHLAHVANSASHESEHTLESPDDFATMSRINLVRASTAHRLRDIYDHHQHNQHQLCRDERHYAIPLSPKRSHPNWSMNSSSPSPTAVALASEPKQHSRPFHPADHDSSQLSMPHIDEYPAWDIVVRPPGMPPEQFAAHSRVNPFTPTVQAIARAYLTYPQLPPQLSPLPTPSPMLLGDNNCMPLALPCHCVGTVLTPLGSHCVVTQNMIAVISEEQRPAFDGGNHADGYGYDDSSSINAKASAVWDVR